MNANPKQICYYTCFVIVYLFIWGLISIPTIFFYLPPNVVEENDAANSTNGSISDLAAQVTEAYFKSVVVRLNANNQTTLVRQLQVLYASSPSQSLDYAQVKTIGAFPRDLLLLSFPNTLISIAREYNISPSIWSRQCNDPLIPVPNSLNCTPPCVFPLLTDPEQTATDVLLAVSIIVTELAGLFTLATWLHLPVLSTFPHIIPLYIVGESMVLALIWTMPLLITRVTAFCGGDMIALPGSIETAFCTFQGIGLQYLTVSMALWFFCYVFNIHVTIVYNKADYVLRNQKAHLIQSLICWVLPIANVIVSFFTEDEYGNNYHWARSDIFTCTPANKNVYYYCMVLPIQLLMGAAATMLANNVSFLKTSRESTAGMKLVRRATDNSGVSSLEKRLAALGITFVVVVFYDISRATYLLWSGTRLRQDVREYTFCKQVRPDCDESWRAHVAAPLTIISSVTVGVFCCASLLFLVGTPATTQLWKYWIAKACMWLRCPGAEEKFAEWAAVPKWHRSVTKRRRASKFLKGEDGKRLETLRANTQTVMMTPASARHEAKNGSLAGNAGSRDNLLSHTLEVERCNGGEDSERKKSITSEKNEAPEEKAIETKQEASETVNSKDNEIDSDEDKKAINGRDVVLTLSETKEDESRKEPLSPEETDITYL